MSNKEPALSKLIPYFTLEYPYMPK